jgi:hypothetical protein
MIDPMQCLAMIYQAGEKLAQSERKMAGDMTVSQIGDLGKQLQMTITASKQEFRGAISSAVLGFVGSVAGAGLGIAGGRSLDAMQVATQMGSFVQRGLDSTGSAMNAVWASRSTADSGQATLMGSLAQGPVASWMQQAGSDAQSSVQASLQAMQAIQSAFAQMYGVLAQNMKAN